MTHFIVAFIAFGDTRIAKKKSSTVRKEIAFHEGEITAVHEILEVIRKVAKVNKICVTRKTLNHDNFKKFIDNQI